MRFVAIDFETANYSDASICAAGLAVFEDGQLTDSRYWLIKPPKGYGWFREDFIAIHGITHEDVRHAPEFSVIAPELLAELTAADLVVAHNAGFDLRKLRGTLGHFGIACPPFKHACTLALSRQVWPELPSHALDRVASHIGHVFSHHNALADAEAAGRVMVALMATPSLSGLITDSGAFKDVLMNMPNSTVLVPKPIPVALKQVAAWDLEHLNAPCDIKASVPALQRGLVWSPQQVELLWDSILRGFPIGSLVVSQQVAQQERSDKRGVNRHLLDGQQRCNAITLGYHDPFGDHPAKVRYNKSESILWIDLAPRGTTRHPGPRIPQNSTREFLTRVTTLAHPWGYRADDNASRLSASEAAEAIKSEFDSKKASEPRPTSLELFPWCANAPVPLSWLMAAIEETNGQVDEEQGFWRVVSSQLKQESGRRKWPLKTLDALECDRTGSDLHAIYLGICRAASTQIVVIEAPSDLLHKSRQEESIHTDDAVNIASIEHLFNRLNRQGTTLDGEELAYSMIKAYWPEIADVVDSVTTARIPASKLVALCTRAALTAPGSPELARPLGIARLRAIANSSSSHSDAQRSMQEKQRSQIEQFIGIKDIGEDDVEQHRLARACKTVDEWLTYHPVSTSNGLPPVLVSNFARRSGDLYLFFLHIADRLRTYKNVIRDPQWKDLVPGAAMLVHWFAKPGETLAIADTLMKAVAGEASPENVRK